MSIATNRYLVVGQSGDSIRTLQQTLEQAGCDVDVNGTFDSKTLGAVRAFQASHDCAVDGIVGPQTLGALGLITPQPAPGASGLTPPSAAGASLRTPAPLGAVSAGAPTTGAGGHAFLQSLITQNVSRP